MARNKDRRENLCMKSTSGNKSLKLFEDGETQGSAWGMRAEVVTRAEHAIYEAATIVGLLYPHSPPIEINMEFDERNFEVEMEYQGLPFELATRPPAVEEMASDAGVAAMSSYLIRQYADRVRMTSRENQSYLKLHFEH